MKLLETVRWRDGRVRILDQTLLPGAEVYPELGTVEEVCGAIRTLAVRGAPAIGVAGALGLALAARELEPTGRSLPDLWREFLAAHARLAAVRPTAVNLRWALDRVRDRCETALGELAAAGPADREGALACLRTVSLREGEAILEEDLALSRAMAGHGFPLLPAAGTVVTHCNTGGLATAGGGTALGVVMEAAGRGKRLFVCVDETRPLLQGARLTAWELARAGIPFAVQCDGAAAWRMKTRRVDAVLVGADRVAANGDTANKLGTFSLALAAREFGVPFWVVAPRSSFDLSVASGEQIPIEERAEDEVLCWGGVRSTPEGARAWNPAFDVTPAALISGWITERGVERPPFAA